MMGTLQFEIMIGDETETDNGNDWSKTHASHPLRIVRTFEDLNLRPLLLRGVYGYGFEKPSKIQQCILEPGTLGHDLVIQASSGTGKTAAFAVVLLQRLNLENRHCQAIVVVPTRELAIGISRLIAVLGEYVHVTCHSYVGGIDIRDHILRLKEGTQIMVGTPGRILDVLRRCHLPTDTIRTLVFDELDEMLSRGFEELLYGIRSMLPDDVQTMLFDATMSANASELIKRFTHNPIRIYHERLFLTIEGARQFYIYIEKAEWKIDVLVDLYEAFSFHQMVVFCNTRSVVHSLVEHLRARSVPVAGLDGDTDVATLDQTFRDFRTGSTRVLVTTDLPDIRRGIGDSRIIINYEVPQSNKYMRYLHRCGSQQRRHVMRHLAITFTTNADQKELREIEQFFQTTILEMPADVTDLI